MNTADRIVSALKIKIERAKYPVPAGISNRHVHLTEEDFKTLFGSAAEPTSRKNLVQPGQFAAEEKVEIAGPKGSIKNVRMIGPCRSYTQAELSASDARALGVEPPIRDSGKLDGAPGLLIKGPRGIVRARNCAIIAKRHIHFSPEDAKRFKINDRQEVRVRSGRGTERELVFEKVLCRVSNHYALEFHVDVEEANAALLKNGDEVYIV